MFFPQTQGRSNGVAPIVNKLTMVQAANALGVDKQKLYNDYNAGKLDGLVTREYNDTRTEYKLVVYSHDLEALRAQVKFRAPSQVRSVATLTSNEVLKRLGMTRRALGMAVYKGRIAPSAKHGRNNVYLLSEVERYAAYRERNKVSINAANSRNKAAPANHIEAPKKATSNKSEAAKRAWAVRKEKLANLKAAVSAVAAKDVWHYVMLLANNGHKEAAAFLIKSEG